MTDLNVSIIQTKIHWHDPEKNREWMSEKINQIYGLTDVIVLPEMFTTGFTMEAARFAEPLEGPSMKWMQKEAAKRNAAVVGSLIIKDKDNFYNRLIWMLPDGSYEYYNKRHLFRMANENKHYQQGGSRVVVKLKGWKICPLVCYDLRFPVWSRNRLINGDFDYDCLIYIANWPEKRSHAWKSLLVARAIENQCYLIAVNRIGIDGNDINHSGDSGVFDFLGNRISKTERFGDKVETVKLFRKELEEFRTQFPMLLDADNFQINP